MKTVFDNAMVAHLWANQSQPEARSNNGNFWYEGTTLYSYSTPIAVMSPANVSGGFIALVTNETFSMTTSSKHMPELWKATDYGRSIPVFRVPCLGVSGGRLQASAAVQDMHTVNLEYLRAAYIKQLTKYRRMSRPNPNFSQMLTELASAAIDYARYFGLPANHWTLSMADADATMAAAEAKARYEANNTPEQRAKRAREAEKRAARAAAKAVEAERLARLDGAERLAAWYAGEHIDLPYAMHATGALLRVRGKTLETSMGAEVPLEHAIKVFRFARLCRERGDAWQANGHTIRVGHFTVSAIRNDGSIIAGCHTIQWVEIERLARSIGVWETSVDVVAAKDALEPSAY